jgi:glycosyltransferase involved in cell wall biosynthesis
MASLAWLIERASQAGIGVHCFFHATADLVRDGTVISLAPIAPALAKADRLYVHGIQDLNRLKEYGLVDNVVLFPQGVLPTPDGSGESERAALGLSGKRIVASYGFLLPGKGVPQLVDAFAALAAEDPAWHLLLLNARYPAPESEAEEAACRALIAQHDLTGRVTLVTDFLPDAESLARLQMADLIVYPYQQTRESSSAAVRMGLAAGRPVAVTPLSIFEDVADAVHFLPGTDAAALADGIRHVLSSTKPSELVKRAEAWAAPRQWPALSVRLLNIIDGIANPLPGTLG